MAFNTSTPTCIFHAATFLTYPLTAVFPAPALSALQTILNSTLHAAFLDCKSAKMSLHLSPSTLPPRPIYAACIASGMSWSNWISALGGGSFELCVSTDEVLVKVDGIMQEHEISVWKQEKSHVEVPISKTSRHVQLAPLRRGIQRRTLAQQLIESDEEETEEMFRMISSGIVSPTPSREAFNFGLKRTDSFDSIPSISRCSRPSPPSRPSSRSSNSSSSSADSDFSYSSSEESMTSVSTASSFSSKKVFKATSPIYVPPQRTAPVFGRPSLPTPTFPQRATRVPLTMAQPRLLSLPSLLPVPTLQLTPPTPVAAVPTPSSPFVENEEESSNIVIDTTRKPTAYLYQGGKSTVLTGGVMLGGVSPSIKKPVQTQTQKYRAPIGGRRTAQAEAGSWRRNAAPIRA